MKMKHLILLLLLALITMVGCLSPDMKGIDPIVDETTPSDKGERGLVSLPDPFGVIDRSGEARNIDLLIPGATQLIEWKVDEHFCFVNIYLYNESKLYRTIAENIDNVGKYDWESEETLDMAHDYEVVVSQHNGTPDENPYLTGDISSKFSMYPSPVKNAQTLVNTLLREGTEEEKGLLLFAYIDAFARQGMEFMKGSGIEENPSGIDRNDLFLYLMSLPNPNDDIDAFFDALKYSNLVNSTFMNAVRAFLILNGCSVWQDDLGNWNYQNQSGETVRITSYSSGYEGYPYIIIWFAHHARKEFMPMLDIESGILVVMIKELGHIVGYEYYHVFGNGLLEWFDPTAS